MSRMCLSYSEKRVEAKDHKAQSFRDGRLGKPRFASNQNVNHYYLEVL